MTMRTLMLGVICAFLAGCGGPDGGPEEAVRAWVESAETYAGNKDRSGLMGLIDENYTDARGNDHTQIGNMLRYYFLRQESVGFVSNINEIKLMGNSAAQVNMTVVMAGTNTNTPGFRADAYNFELELESLDDEWRLIGARWGEVGEEMR